MQVSSQRSFDEAFEQRVSVMWLRLELRMVLHRHEPRVCSQFDNLDQAAIRTCSRHLQSGIDKLLTIRRIELISMSMTFADFALAVSAGRASSFGQNAGLSAQSHRAALVPNAFLAFEQTDDRMLRFVGEFRAVRIGQPEHISSELDDGALHAETDPEERDITLASVLNGLNFAFDTSHTEAARNQNPVDALEQNFWPLTFQFFGFDSLDDDLCRMMEAGMVDRLVDGFVRISMFDVLSDNGNCDFVFRIANAMHEGSVVVHFQWTGRQVQLLADQLVQTMFNQADRNFVNGEFFVDFFNDRLLFDVAE